MNEFMKALGPEMTTKDDILKYDHQTHLVNGTSFIETQPCLQLKAVILKTQNAKYYGYYVY